MAAGGAFPTGSPESYLNQLESARQSAVAAATLAAAVSGVNSSEHHHHQRMSQGVPDFRTGLEGLSFGKSAAAAAGLSSPFGRPLGGLGWPFGTL